MIMIHDDVEDHIINHHSHCVAVQQSSTRNSRVVVSSSCSYYRSIAPHRLSLSIAISYPQSSVNNHHQLSVYRSPITITTNYSMIYADRRRAMMMHHQEPPKMQPHRDRASFLSLYLPPPLVLVLQYYSYSYSYWLLLQHSISI